VHEQKSDENRFTHVHPIQYMNAWADPTHHPKRQLNRFTYNSAISAQLRNKGPIGYNGTPKFTSKLLPSLRRSPPHLIYPSLDRPHLPSQWHPDPLSRFATVNLRTDRLTDRQTDWQTDRWSRRMFRNISAYTRLTESDALIIIYIVTAMVQSVYVYMFGT